MSAAHQEPLAGGPGREYRCHERTTMVLPRGVMTLSPRFSVLADDGDDAEVGAEPLPAPEKLEEFADAHPTSVASMAGMASQSVPATRGRVPLSVIRPTRQCRSPHKGASATAA
jgi:hypothetical protein